MHSRNRAAGNRRRRRTRGPSRSHCPRRSSAARSFTRGSAFRIRAGHRARRTRPGRRTGTAPPGALLPPHLLDVDPVGRVRLLETAVLRTQRNDPTPGRARGRRPRRAAPGPPPEEPSRRRLAGRVHPLELGAHPRQPPAAGAHRPDQHLDQPRPRPARPFGPRHAGESVRSGAHAAAPQQPSLSNGLLPERPADEPQSNQVGFRPNSGRSPCIRTSHSLTCTCVTPPATRHNETTTHRATPHRITKARGQRHG